MNTIENQQKPVTLFNAFFYLFAYLWPVKAYILRLRVILALLMLICAKICIVYAPLFFKDAIDVLDKRIASEVIIPFALLFIYGGLRLCAIVFQELRELLFIKVAQSAIRKASLQVFRHLHQLSMRFHLERQTGGITTIIDRGTRGMDFLLSVILFNILPTIIELLMVSAILWGFFNIYYALITIATIVIYVIFTLVITEWRVKFRRRANKEQSIASTKTIDSLLNYETVKYFTKEDFEAKNLEKNLYGIEKARILTASSLSAVNIGQSFIISTGLIILLLMAAFDYNANIITLGDFVLVNSYLLQLYIPLNFLGFVYRQTRQSLIDMEDMFGLLSYTRDIADKDNAPDIVIKNCHIIFNNVNFSYDDKRQILHHLSLDIPALSSVAIVGASGSGKTSLSRLLFRFYDIDDGHITIDGQDIRDVNQQSLRRAIGIVPQDTVLFNDTICYNIAYGALDITTQDDIENTAKSAQIHDFIMSLPDGYDTIVGERGLKLSGGEKQRVAIARMLLKNPKIMIFDEATSALDSETEYEIMQNINHISKNYTTIMIAHRLSTIIHCDCIFVMDNGKIAEQGNHQSLLQQNNLYAQLWKNQIQ